ncbi:MAG: IS256 family transposase [Lentisphaeria bacterium]|nr:IS256 family transposase [Lentisphaeria bacterium]
MAKRVNCDEYLDEMQAHADGDMLKAMIETMARTAMEAEITRHLGAEFYERGPGRKGQRNGYKPRTLNTRVGQLALEVPQARGAEPYHPLLFGRYERSERALLTACAEMYFMGVSTRKVGKVLEKMGGFELSAATVSKVAMEIDEKLGVFRERRLDGQTWPVIIVDACYLKVRHRGHVQNRTVLVVAGVNGDGRREILAWRVAASESADTWGEIFNDVRQRGVSGVKWIISDGHEGIQAAARLHFTEASWQRCWTHFMRNALNKVGHKDKKALAKDLVVARRHDELNTCLMEAERVAARYEERYPRLAKQIRDQFEETMAVHGLPKEHQRRMYTSNMLERLMLEIKRRTRVVGIFPNDASCDRLVGAQLLERQETWQCERARYLNMEHLERREAERVQTGEQT